MTVYVLYDAMNEEVVGVFSTLERAQRASHDDPQFDMYLYIDAFVVDVHEVRR